MFNFNVQFESNASNLEVMLDACFPRQHKAHVEAWRYHQNKMLKDARNAAIDALLMKELACHG